MLRTVIEKAWYDYCDNVLNPDPNNKAWTVVFAEGLGGERPPKPYVTLKIISGPRKISIDDNLRNEQGTDNFHLVGQRGYTLSIKSFGADYIDGLSDISTEIENPDHWEQLKADADISVIEYGDVSDISAKLETGFEKRATLDIIFNSSNNKLTTIGPIESVEISGSIDSGTKIINTNLPIINKG